MHRYVYLIIRTDLPLAQQIIQTAHAAQECGLYLSDPGPEPDYICMLAVPDEDALLELGVRIQTAGVQYRLICEPDLGNQATAIATEPITGSRRKLFRGAMLWTAPTTHAEVA